MEKTIHFEGMGPGKWSYRRLGFRPPRKGEFYLSGAIVQAWRAPNDLGTPYHVVEPLEVYKPQTVWVRA